jgi:putative addiction module killer protein
MKMVIYETKEGKQPFKEWLESQRDMITIVRVKARLKRIESGNFGDTKSVGFGVMELRLNFGSGHRIYYGLHENKLVVLLTGGNKSTQVKDIKTAYQYWMDYLRRAKYGQI